MVFVAMIPSRRELERQVGDRVDVLVGEVGGDLHQHRALEAEVGELLPDGGDEPAQRLDRLQVAQAGRVGRGDVEHEVVGVRGEPAHGARGSRSAACSLLAPFARPTLTPSTVARAAAGDPRRDRLGAGVREAHAVLQRAVGGQAPHARARVARLRERGDGADLDGAEAERAQALEPARVLVDAGGDAERAREAQAERVDGQHRVRAPGEPQQPEPVREPHAAGGEAWAVSGGIRRRTSV